MFEKGTKVRQIMPKPVEGEVDMYTVDQNTGKVQVHVTWADANGDTHGTYFFAHELEAVAGQE